MRHLKKISQFEADFFRDRLQKSLAKEIAESKKLSEYNLPEEVGKRELETARILYYENYNTLISDHSYIEKLTLRIDTISSGFEPAVKPTGENVQKIRLIFKPFSIYYFLKNFGDSEWMFVRNMISEWDTSQLAFDFLRNDIDISRFLYYTEFHSRVIEEVDDFYSRSSKFQHGDIESSVTFRPELDSVTYNVFVYYEDYFINSYL